MNVKLDTVVAREKLKPRREPYWQRLDSGCMLGYRKMTASSVGSWTARYRNADTGERPKKALGEFAGLPASERYSAAKKIADAWFSHLGRGGAAESITVKTACENFLKHLRDAKRESAADDIEARFKRWVYGSKIANTELPKLSKAQMLAWRTVLASTEVVENPHASKDKQRTRPRSLSSLNRDMTPLRAALNHAHELGQVTTDQAWLVALKPAKNADGRREVYLDLEQRRKLIAAAPADVGALMRGLAMVPLRPGALASLTAKAFDAKLGVLRVGKDKAGSDRRLKLPTATAAWFEAQAKDKLPAARLLTRADGKPWTKDAWKKPIKEAAAAAGLPDRVVMYALRHSAITDLVVGGLDLLTVAQLSGTSVVMIEKHYGHLRADHAAKALEALAL